MCCIIERIVALWPAFGTRVSKAGGKGTNGAGSLGEGGGWYVGLAARGPDKWRSFPSNSSLQGWYHFSYQRYFAGEPFVDNFGAPIIYIITEEYSCIEISHTPHPYQHHVNGHTVLTKWFVVLTKFHLSIMTIEFCSLLTNLFVRNYWECRHSFVSGKFSRTQVHNRNICRMVSVFLQ